MTLRQNLFIRQGETWSFNWVYTDPAGAPMDLTGYSARMAIRYGFELTSEAYLSTGADASGGSITLGGSDGTVTLSMTPAQTSALAGDLTTILFQEPRKRADRYVDFIYDLELVDASGAITRVLEGEVRVQREVTTG